MPPFCALACILLFGSAEYMVPTRASVFVTVQSPILGIECFSDYAPGLLTHVDGKVVCVV